MKEALKLALEALTNAIAVRNGEGGTKLVSPLEENAITAAKEALAPTSTQCEVQSEQSWSWVCNECGAREFTSAVSEADLEYLACAGCGCSDFHKEALAQPDYRAVKTYHEGKPVYVSQPEQEPVAWRNAAVRIGEELSSVGPDGYYNMTAQQWLDWAMEQKPRGKNSLAQPLQRPWVGLTEQEVTAIDRKYYRRMGPQEFSKEIEAKLKEKNT